MEGGGAGASSSVGVGGGGGGGSGDCHEDGGQPPPGMSQSQDCEPTPPLPRHPSKTNFFQSDAPPPHHHPAFHHHHHHHHPYVDSPRKANASQQVTRPPRSPHSSRPRSVPAYQPVFLCSLVTILGTNACCYCFLVFVHFAEGFTYVNNSGVTIYTHNRVPKDVES